VAVRLLAGSELVMIAWLKSAPGVLADVIATQPPLDETQWAANGCIAVSVVGGHPDPDVPVRNPVMQLDFFATNPGSARIPWFKASDLAEQVWMATRDRQRIGRIVSITSGGKAYPPAKVLTAFWLTEPRRIYNDRGDWAHYQGDLALSWTITTPIPNSY
jgi:hypothetical protein